MAFFEVIPITEILLYGGIGLGLGGAMLGVLAWSGRFEGQRPGLERWARRIGYTGLTLLVIFAGLVVLTLIAGLFFP